jgi:hypothetical protein
VHAPGHANETERTIQYQGLNNDKLTITSVGGKFASQAILNRYWATAEGKKQLFTISPMSELAGIDPNLAQASARIEVSSNGLIITISGLAPIQGVLSNQTITINPIALEDATNSSAAITAVSGQ